MTALELAGIVLSSEFALVALALPAFLLRRQHRQVSADTVAAEALIDTVEAKVPSRRDALSTIFSTTYRLEGEELDAKVDEFVAREQAFYQVMTRVYLERDGDGLKALPEELTKVISPWLRLTPRNLIDPASVSALETTNAALNAELDETKRSMADLMNEYTAAFDKERALETAAAAKSTAAMPPAAAATGVGPLAVSATPIANRAVTDRLTDTSGAAALARPVSAVPAEDPDIDIEALFDQAQQPFPTADTDDIVAQSADDAPAPAGHGPEHARDASAPEPARVDYIDVSEDADEGAFSQEDIDALTSLFESEIEDTPAAASAA